MLYAMIFAPVSVLNKNVEMKVQVRVERNSNPETHPRPRDPEITLNCELRGSEEHPGPGYYLILLRQHHANSRRRWYRRVFVLSE
jgi:hypothetical protein